MSFSNVHIVDMKYYKQKPIEKNTVTIQEEDEKAWLEEVIDAPWTFNDPKSQRFFWCFNETL